MTTDFPPSGPVVSPTRRRNIPVVAALTLSVLCLALIGIASYRSTRLFRESSDWVGHTREVLFETEAALAALLEAESGTRGYVITGNEAYLGTFQQSRVRVGHHLSRLALLTADNPEQEGRLRRILPLVDARIQRLDQAIAIRRERGFAPAREAIMSDSGRAIMNNLHTLFTAVAGTETRLLDVRYDQEQADARRTQFLLIAGNTLAVLLLSFAGVRLYGELRSRQRANAELSVIRSELEKRVLLRTAELGDANTRLESELKERRRMEGEIRHVNLNLEQVVAARTKALAETNAELEAFTYSVSHDLRAPLRAMHGFAAALEEDFGSTIDPVALQYAQRILKGAARLDRLIQDLLQYSRVSRTDLKLERIDLAQMVRDVVRDMEGTLPPGTRVAVELSPAGLPTMAHRATLAQVVNNLISNAVKFMPPGKTPTVRITAEPRADRVRLHVEDNGIGMAPEHLERIFQVFERLHGNETYPGTGIGLGIVRRGMERMQGAAGVESTLGEGSNFWIELVTA